MDNAIEHEHLVYCARSLVSEQNVVVDVIVRMLLHHALQLIVKLPCTDINV